MLVFFYELIFHRWSREKMLTTFLGYHALVALSPILASRMKFHLIRRFNALFLETLLFRFLPLPCASYESLYPRSPALAQFL